jgi:DNA-directed RNA polymerase omega subunit
MARITSQKAAQIIGSQFDLVLVAAQRARELARGSRAKVEGKNGFSVTALKEIEEGLYTKKDYLDSLHKKGNNDERQSAKSKRYSKPNF